MAYLRAYKRTYEAVAWRSLPTIARTHRSRHPPAPPIRACFARTGSRRSTPSHRRRHPGQDRRLARLFGALQEARQERGDGGAPEIRRPRVRDIAAMVGTNLDHRRLPILLNQVGIDTVSFDGTVA